MISSGPSSRIPPWVGFQPPLEVGLGMIGLERQLLVFREPAVRLNAENSHLWADIIPVTNAIRGAAPILIIFDDRG